MNFVNKTGINLKLKVKKKTQLYDPFGSSVREQIGRTLMQVGTFTVIEQPRQRKARALQQDKESGTNEAALPSQEEPELILSGTLLTYAPSQTSLNVGLPADPLLGAKEGYAAEQLFKTFSERVTGEPDRVAFAVELADAKTKERIHEASFDCVSQDWASLPTDIFGEGLRASFPPPQTPMQEAMQGCLAKVTNWIGERYLAWRENPPPPADIPFDAMIQKQQQGLNKLGYNCGKEDGKRGPKTQECIEKFLQDNGIQEPDLESAMEKKLAEQARVPSGEQPKPPAPPRPTWWK
jgi:hypothetical protein